MGSFYVNHTVCAPDLTIVDRIEEIKPAYVSKPINGCLVIFDEKSESQDEQSMQDINIFLSKRFHGTVFSVLIHDDSVMLYWLSTKGEFEQKYNSMPGYFLGGEPLSPTGGSATQLCAAFGSVKVVEVEKILQADAGSEKYIFETDRHKDLIVELDLPAAAAGMSYSYIAAGDFLSGFSASDFRTLEN